MVPHELRAIIDEIDSLVKSHRKPDYNRATCDCEFCDEYRDQEKRRRNAYERDLTNAAREHDVPRFQGLWESEDAKKNVTDFKTVWVIPMLLEADSEEITDLVLEQRFSMHFEYNQKDLLKNFVRDATRRKANGCLRSIKKNFPWICNFR